MKKVSAKRRRYAMIVSRRRTARSLRSKKKAYLSRFFATRQPGQEPSKRTAWQRSVGRTYGRPIYYLKAPAVFGLQQAHPRSLLLRFIRDLRNATLKWKCKVWIDFRDTRQMQPAGTLLFAAELDRIRRASDCRTLVRCFYPTDNVVEQVLQHLGLLELMKRRPRATISADNVRYWRVESDNVADGRHAEKLATEYKRLFADAGRNRMYDGLVEAMTNCVQHAYTHQRRDGTGLETDRRWWMFSEERDGKLSVAFCDLGIGIDRALSTGERWSLDHVRQIVTSLGRKNPISRYIKAATVVGRSGTQQSHRGKGLQDLKNVIGSVDNGWMQILSNEGSYRFSAHDKSERLKDFHDSILGTLILWRLPVPKGV